jgi:PAS domain S-box-containing protein
MSVVIEKTKEELLKEIAILQEKINQLEQTAEANHLFSLSPKHKTPQLTFYKNEHQHSEELICLHDLTGKIIRVNDEVEELFDVYTKEGSFGNVKSLLAPDVRHLFQDYLQEAIVDKQVDGKLKLMDKHGNIHFYEYNAFLEDNDQPNPYIRCHAWELNPSKYGRNETNEFYKSLYDSNISSIFLLNPDGIILDANETALQRFGFSREDMTSANFIDVLAQNEIEIDLDKLEDILQDAWFGRSVKIFTNGIDAKGNAFTLEMNFKKGKFFKKDIIICLGDDITKEQDDEQAIIAKFNELRIIKETLRYVSGQYRINDVLIMALEKLYELDYIRSAGIYLLGKNHLQARLRFYMNFENVLLQYLLEINVEDYLNVFSEKQSFELPPKTLCPEQDKVIIFVPIVVENKVNYVLIFKLETDKQENSSLLLNLLGTELSSYLTQTQLNNKLVQSENRFRIIADNSPSLLRMTDWRNEFNFFSQPWFTFTGRSNERQLRDGWKELIHEEDIEPLLAHLKDDFAEKKSFEVSYRLKRSDGMYRWMQENGTPYYDQEGDFKGYICSAVDITERRQKEREKSQEDAIKYSKERLQKGLSQANIFAISVEKDGMISFCNDFFYQKTQWQEAQIIGKYLFDIFEPDLDENTIQISQIDGFLNSFEGKLQTADEHRIHIRFNTIVLNDKTGNISSVTIVGEDISEKIRFEEALKESNARLQDLFDNANDLIQVTGASGKILFANRAWKQTLAYSDEELQDLKIMDILHPDYAVETYKTFGKVKKTGEVSNARTALVSKGGKRIDLAGSFSYEEKDNEFRAYLYNITEKIRAEKAQTLYYNIATLTLNSTNLENLYEGFYNALKRVIEVDSFLIALKDRYDENKIYFPYYVNSQFAPREGIQGINFAKHAVTKFERPMFFYEDLIKQIIIRKNIIPDTVMPKVWLGVPLKLGEKIIGMIILQAFKDYKLYTKKDLELLSFISGQLAIAIKRSQNQEEISHQAARLKAVFDSGTHLMWTVNRQMLITRFNQKASSANTNVGGNNIVPEELIGILDQNDQMQQGEFLYFWLNKYRKTFEGKQQHFESKIINEQGEEVWYEIFLNPIRISSSDGLEEISGVAHNITAKKKYELALAEAKEIAEKSLEVKKRFLSNMSHEIRTPMNGIIGMIELLADSQLDEEQQSWITTMRKSSETLLNILNDILDLSKIEAGKMELRIAPLSLQAVIDKLFALFAQRALSKDISMVYYFGTQVPLYVNADETRLLQILSNLTSNALKFTEHGEININFSHLAQRDKWHRIKVEVQDTGIGIPEDKLNVLFKAFSQADNSYTKSYGGTGLGLVISQELSKLMNGEIGVFSELGKGSTFWFSFEAEECLPEEVPKEEVLSNKEGSVIERINSSIRLLVVDDNAVNLKVAKSILQKAGCKVETAQSGQSAINLVQQNDYDLIFMDIQMPIMNGVMTTEKIKTLGLSYVPPIIAMTAFSMQEERQSFLDAGMDDYVSKPIKAQILINKVKEWIIKLGLQTKVEAQINDIEKEQDTVSQELADSKKNYLKELVLDKNVADQLRKYGDDEMIAATYQEFEEETTNIINELVISIQNQDYKEAMGHAHTIKGSAGTLGIERLSAHAAKMEKDFRNGLNTHAEQDLTTTLMLFDEFKNSYKDILGIEG